MIQCPCGECAVRLRARSELHGFCTVVSKARKCENRSKQEAGLARQLLVNAGDVQNAGGDPAVLKASVVSGHNRSDHVLATVQVRPSSVCYWAEQDSSACEADAGLSFELHAGNILACFNHSTGVFDVPVENMRGAKMLCENHPPLSPSGTGDEAHGPLVCRHCLHTLRYAQARSYEGAAGPRGHPLNRVHFGCPRDALDKRGTPVALVGADSPTAADVQRKHASSGSSSPSS